MKSKSKRNRAIISTIINTANNLNIRCIAEGVEGVEEKDQLDFLIDIG